MKFGVKACQSLFSSMPRKHSWLTRVSCPGALAGVSSNPNPGRLLELVQYDDIDLSRSQGQLTHGLVKIQLCCVGWVFSEGGNFPALLG